eukprot:SAG31_NODE_1139_length_9713_cov_28.936863_2_plen_73_part_00
MPLCMPPAAGFERRAWIVMDAITTTTALRCGLACWNEGSLLGWDWFEMTPQAAVRTIGEKAVRTPKRNSAVR